MKNDQWQFVVRTSDFYLSLFICHFAICHLSRCQLPACSVCPTLGTQDACAPRGTEKNPFPLAKGLRLAQSARVSPCFRRAASELLIARFPAGGRRHATIKLGIYNKVLWRRSMLCTPYGTTCLLSASR